MKEPKIENRLKLLREIQENNCREVISCEVNMRVGEWSKLKYPNKMEQIHQFIQIQKQRKEDLTMGIEIIDDEISKISKK